MIKLKNIKDVDFCNELKKINLNETAEFELSDAFAKNAPILFFYLKHKKIKKIIISKNSAPLDMACYNQFSKYIRKYFLILTKDITIEFKSFTDEEINLLLMERNYINYAYIHNIPLKWDEKTYENEIKKIEQNKHLQRYDTFCKLVDFQKKNPFSYFNLPTEEGADRFVFYFHMHSKQQQNKILKLINDLNIQEYEEIVNLIKTNKINEEIYYYALGFVYKNEKLYRLTLYTKFDINQIIKGVHKFIKQKHHTDIEQPYKNIWYYAIDFYSDGHKEIKIYEEPHKFNEIIENSMIYKILANKMCVKVTKYKDNKKINVKYEFETKYFNKLEQRFLIKNKIYKQGSKVFAIYIHKNKLVKTISYKL